MMRKTMAIAMLLLASISVCVAKGTDVATADSNFIAEAGTGMRNKLGDTIFVQPFANNPVISYENLVHERLSSIQKMVPLDYNEYVQHYIDVLSSRGKEKISKALGLSKYYFPIYEKIFQEENIPEEIKFLSVVESELNPNAVSHVGATGLWQFMFTTGKTYGLNIDEWVDERKDPVAASYAAAAYLRDSYDQFGDWLLAIASYNCGTGNVRRAIAKAGGEYDFWAIRPYLPRETQNYVPAYIATVYMMKYHEIFDINPRKADFSIETEVLQINHEVSLANIAKAINVNLRELCILNPAYKKEIINASSETPKSLIIPLVTNSSYSALYDVLNGQEPVFATRYANKPVPKHRPVYYRVRKGDNLSDIAEKYRVEVQDVKVWNNIKQNVIVPGQTLRVSGTEPGILKITEYFTYKVQPGDTLLRIAEKFQGVTVTGLKMINELADADLKPGMLLKIVRG